MEMIAIGKIRTSHGVKGFVKIACYSGETEHFYKLKEILLKNNSLEISYKIEEIIPHGDSIIMKFEGVETPEKAKTLSGWEIWVSRDKASSLSEGEYYHADLCQCSFQYDNEIIGNVISILEGGAGELFEVELISGKTVLIPFKDEFIGAISIGKKLIELKNKWILG